MFVSRAFALAVLLGSLHFVAIACGGNSERAAPEGDESVGDVPTSSGLATDGTFLNFDGRRYELQGTTEGQLPADEFTEIGVASEADIDFEGELVVYRRARDDYTVYTLPLGLSEDRGEADVVLVWQEWKPAETAAIGAEEEPTKTVVIGAEEVLSRARAALFDGREVIHITVPPASSYGLGPFAYAEAWLDQRTDRLRLRINPERLVQEPRPWEEELFVDGYRYFGLDSKGAPGYNWDLFAVLFPLDFITRPGYSEGVVVDSQRPANDDVIVLKRHSPEANAIDMWFCPRDERAFFDADSFLPLRIERQSYACGSPASSASAIGEPSALDFHYERLAPSALEPGFFDPDVLRATVLEESLARIRAAPITAYWLGPDELSEIEVWQEGESAGANFRYGHYMRADFTVLASLANAPSGTRPMGYRCPLREGPGGVVVGDLPTETTETSYGPAEYCPSDAWLTLTIGIMRIQISPGPVHESREEMAAIANQLRPVQ
jgi:hypothetical protein